MSRGTPLKCRAFAAPLAGQLFRVREKKCTPLRRNACSFLPPETFALPGALPALPRRSPRRCPSALPALPRHLSSAAPVRNFIPDPQILSVICDVARHTTQVPSLRGAPGRPTFRSARKKKCTPLRRNACSFLPPGAMLPCWVRGPGSWGSSGRIFGGPGADPERAVAGRWRGRSGAAPAACRPGLAAHFSPKKFYGFGRHS